MCLFRDAAAEVLAVALAALVPSAFVPLSVLPAFRQSEADYSAVAPFGALPTIAVQKGQPSPALLLTVMAQTALAQRQSALSVESELLAVPLGRGLLLLKEQEKE